MMFDRNADIARHYRDVAEGRKRSGLFYNGPFRRSTNWTSGFRAMLQPAGSVLKAVRPRV